MNPGESDFESLRPINFINATDIRLFITNDDISLEYDDMVRLTFTPDSPDLISDTENQGMYVRETATVNIVDNDCEYVSDIEEGLVKVIVLSLQYRR